VRNWGKEQATGGSGYEAGTYCVALDCNTEDKSPETRELTVITQ
jgi:hypothetical protein